MGNWEHLIWANNLISAWCGNTQGKYSMYNTYYMSQSVIRRNISQAG